MKKTILISGLFISLFSSLHAQVAPKKDTLILKLTPGQVQIVYDALNEYSSLPPKVLNPLLNSIVSQANQQLNPSADTTKIVAKPVTDSTKSKIKKP